VPQIGDLTFDVGQRDGQSQRAHGLGHIQAVHA
jgi:hypothetical protein